MAISRPRLIEQGGLLGRLPVRVAQPAPVAVAPQRVVAAPAAAPAPAPVPAPAAWAGHESFKTEEARKALRDWLSAGGTLPVEETDGGVSQGMAEVGDFIFRPNPDYYGGGYQAQRGNVTYAFDPKFNLQRSYTQSGNTVNTYDVDGSLIKSYTPQGGFGSFLKTVAPIALSAFGAPYLAGALGGGLGATIGAGALTGAAGAAIAGGDPLKGAVMGGIGGGIGYGVNNSGLLGSVGDAASAGSSSDLYSLGNASLGEVTAPGGLYDLGSANLGNATGLGGTGAGLSATTDIFSGIGGSMATGTGSALSPSVQLGTPNYSLTTADPITTPNGEGLSTGPVNGGTGSGLSATPGSGLTLADPGAANGLLGGAPSAPSIEGMIEQARAAGKSVQDWMRENPLYARAAMMAGGALLNTVGGESKSGGSSYKDDGYRPTISRGGFQASIPAQGSPSGGSGMALRGHQGLISLPTTGQANDGLWRYGLLGR